MRKFLMSFMVLAVLVSVFAVGMVPACANDSAAFFDEDIFTSQNVLKNSFYMDSADSVSLIKEGGVPMISITKEGSPFESNRMISKKKVESQNFEYTVEAAVTKRAGSQFTEIPIIVGVKEGYGTYTQVYINKSIDDTVTIRVAELQSGVFNTIWNQNCEIDNAADDDTFFQIKLVVYGDEMDISVNGEYITSITSSEEDYTGYVGVRCTGTMRIKSMSLVETPDEETQGPADATKDPNAAPSFPTEDSGQSIQTPAMQPTETPKQDEGMSSSTIGAFVVSGIAVLCAAAIVVYTLLRGKKK